MNKKQTITLIICIFMLLTYCVILVGCNNTNIPKSIKQEIVDNWNETYYPNDEIYHIDDFGVFHISYGMFNGYAVYYVETETKKFCMHTVAQKYVFNGNREFAIYCYKDGKNLLLEDAYLQGLVSEDDVKVIYERFWDIGLAKIRNNQIKRNEKIASALGDDSVFVDIPDDIKQQIIDDYNQNCAEEYRVQAFGELHVSYGMVNGYAIYLEKTDVFPCNYYELTLADRYGFTCPDSKFNIYFYKDGKKEAFQSSRRYDGLFTIEDIRTIWERFWEIGTTTSRSV